MKAGQGRHTLAGDTSIWEGAGVGESLTISHDDDDMAGSIPAFRRGLPCPAHHAVHSLESLLGVGP